MRLYRRKLWLTLTEHTSKAIYFRETKTETMLTLLQKKDIIKHNEERGTGELDTHKTYWKQDRHKNADITVPFVTGLQNRGYERMQKEKY